MATVKVAMCILNVQQLLTNRYDTHDHVPALGIAAVPLSLKLSLNLHDIIRKY